MNSRRRTRLFAVAMAATTAVAIGVSGASGLVERTAPATFRVTLDGEPVQTAKAYALDGAVVSGKREYTLRLSLQLTDDTAPATWFQDGQVDSARVDLLRADLVILATYVLANPTVAEYRQTGDAATNDFTEELVLKSKSLTIR